MSSYFHIIIFSTNFYIYSYIFMFHPQYEQVSTKFTLRLRNVVAAPGIKACTKNSFRWQPVSQANLIFVIFLHAHILSHENFTLGKCVNLRQNCQKQYFSGSSGIFLHWAKNFTRTAFAAFVTNIRYVCWSHLLVSGTMPFYFYLNANVWLDHVVIFTMSSPSSL